MKNEIQQLIDLINDGEVDDAASKLVVLKRSWAYGTDIGKKLYKAHEEVTIGSPEKAVHILEDLLFNLKPEKVEITNADLETMHGEPRKAVSGGYGFAARLVWQYEGFIFVDGINGQEVR